MPNESDYNRTLGATAEADAVAIWRAQFPRIEELHTRVNGDYVSEVEDRSSLRLDARYLGRWRGGSLYETPLTAAADHLLTAKTLLEPLHTGQGALPMVGMYPLLRAAIESASLAIYLLAPAERDERLRRAYQVVDDDAEMQTKFALGFATPEDASRRAQVRTERDETRRELQRLAMTRPSMGPLILSPVRYTSVVNTADEAISADSLVRARQRQSLLAWWQIFSGLSHAKQWAFLAASERSEAVLDHVEETARVLMTAAAPVVALGLNRAVEALEVALRIFGQRAHNWTAQPEDAAEPPTIPWTLLREDAGTAETPTA